MKPLTPIQQTLYHLALSTLAQNEGKPLADDDVLKLIERAEGEIKGGFMKKEDITNQVIETARKLLEAL